METVLAVLFYAIAGVFLFMAFGLTSTFVATNSIGALLGSMAYGIGGLVAILNASWWPLLIGFCVAIVLRLLGLDPGYPPPSYPP